MSGIARLGTVILNVLAGQTVVLASMGPGITVVSTAAAVTQQTPPVYTPVASIQGGTYSQTFAQATTVRIDASPASDVEYDFGAAPKLVSQPFSGAGGIVAFAGGGQANATQLLASNNRIITTATTGDSVKLPAATVGAHVTVYNAGAASCNVFPQTGESINSGAANAAFAVATVRAAVFDCAVAGIWHATYGA